MYTWNPLRNRGPKQRMHKRNPKIAVAEWKIGCYEILNYHWFDSDEKEGSWFRFWRKKENKDALALVRPCSDCFENLKKRSEGKTRGSMVFISQGINASSRPAAPRAHFLGFWIVISSPNWYYFCHIFPLEFPLQWMVIWPIWNWFGLPKIHFSEF